MRLVYSDPLTEFKALLKEAQSNTKISHIAITAGELRACLTHLHAETVFPDFIGSKRKNLQHVSEQMKKLRPMLDGNTLSDREKQPLFDRMDELEAREEELKTQIPSALKEGGVLIKVSMR